MAQVIRRGVTATNKRIGVVNFDTDAGAVGQALANAGETLRQAAYKIDAQEAEKAGADAAAAIEDSKFRSFDEKGNPIALKAPEGYGRIARLKFQEVAERRFIETMDNDIRLQAQNLRVKHARNPLGFQNEMDSYLQGLSRGSDGRFKQYIETVGSAVQEATYIGLIEKQRERSRQDNADFIQSQNVDSKISIAALSAQGNQGLSDAMSFAYERATATKSGEEAQLFRKGASQSYFYEASGIAAASHITTEARNFTALERALLEQSISTGQLSSNTKVNNLLNKTIEYKAGDETKSILVRDLIVSANQVEVQRKIATAFQDITSVENIKRQEADRQKAKEAENFRIREDEFNTGANEAIDDLIIDSVQNAQEAFLEDGDINKSIASSFSDYNSLVKRIENEVAINPEFSANEGLVLRNRAMISAAMPFIKRASASGGKPDNFIAALSTMDVNSEAFAASTRQQKEVIIALSQYGFNENLTGEFSATINQAASATVEQIKQEEITFGLVNEFQDILVGVRSGELNDKDVDKFFTKFDKQTKNFEGILAQRFKLTTALDKENARKDLLSFLYSSPLHDAAFIKNVQYYMLTGDPNSLKEATQQKVDKIIKDLPVSSQKELTTLVEKIAVDRGQIELKKEKDLEQYNNVKDFENQSLSNSKGSKVSQLILNQTGFDISDDKTWTRQNMQIAAKYMPEDIINQLKGFARMDRAKNPDNLLMFFGRLYQYTYPDGTIHNVTDGFLDDETELKLRYALTSRRMGRTSNAAQAMEEVNRLFTEPNASAIQARKELLYGTRNEGTQVKTQKEFLRNLLGNDYDVMVASELGMYTDILLASNLPDDQIKLEIKQKFDTKYKEAQYVFDSSRPVGAKNKTRHALDAYLRPPEKEFFVTSVESQLNKFGYTLYDHVNEKGIGKIFDPTSSEKGFIPTVLVPMFPELVRAEDQTFMPMKLVYVSDIGDYELQPIIINEGTDKEFTAAFQIKDEFKDYLGSAGSVTDAIGLEGLQELFKNATTVLGGDRSKPVPLY